MQKYGLQPILRVDTVTMAVRVVDFSNGFIKLERFLPKNQHTKRILLNFCKLLRPPPPLFQLSKFKKIPLGILILRQKSF